MNNCKFDTRVPQWIWGEDVGYILDNSIELWHGDIFVRAKLHAKCYIDKDGDVLETDIINFEIYEYFDEDGALFFPNSMLQNEIYNNLFNFILETI